MMEIAVRPKAFGLPSFDCQSLCLMAVCKFYDLDVEFKECRNPLKSPSYELPFLKERSGKRISGLQEIIDCCTELIKENENNGITDNEALFALLEEKLKPAIDHYLWVDSLNFSEFVRPWYAKATIFPLSMILPTNHHKSCMNKLYFSTGDRYVTDEDREYKIYKDGRECVNMLSQVLDKQNYFNGKNPKLFDALVFGYLAPIINAPFPNAKFQQYVKNCPNLVSFCERITENFFPMSPEEIEKLKKEELKRKENEKINEIEFPNRIRNGILTAVLSISVMVLYAFTSGLISIQIAEEDVKKQKIDSE